MPRKRVYKQSIESQLLKNPGEVDILPQTLYGLGMQGANAGEASIGMPTGSLATVLQRSIAKGASAITETVKKTGIPPELLAVGLLAGVHLTKALIANQRQQLAEMLAAQAQQEAKTQEPPKTVKW